MDKATARIAELLRSESYSESAREADGLLSRIGSANRFQVDAVAAEADAFFSKLREERPAIYALLSTKEKEAKETAFLVRTGRRIVLD